MSKNDRVPASDPNTSLIRHPAAAVALGVVSIASAVIIVLWAMNGYDPKSTVCTILAASGASASSLPKACEFPAWPLICAILIAICGLGAAAGVWKRQ